MSPDAAPAGEGVEGALEGPAGLEEPSGRGRLQAPAGADDELERLLGELGPSASGYRIFVQRVTPNRDPEECFDCPLTAFSKDALRADYGPGHYHVEVRKSGQIKRRWDWHFARPLQAGSSSSSSTIERTARERELEAELGALRARASDRTHELLLALIQRPQAPHAEKDPLQILLQAKELLGLGADRGSPKETLGLVRELLELRDELGGGGERETSAADVVRAGLEKLPELTELLRAAAAVPEAPRGDTSRSRSVTTTAGRSAVTSAARAPASSSTSTSAPAPAAGSKPVTSGDSSMLLAQFVPMILKLSQSGMTAAAAAELVIPRLEALDDEQFGFLATIIAHPECVPMLIRADARLAPIKAWLEELAQELRAFIRRETAEEPLPDAPAAAEPARATTEGTHDTAPRGGRSKGSARGAAKR